MARRAKLKDFATVNADDGGGTRRAGQRGDLPEQVAIVQFDDLVLFDKLLNVAQEQPLCLPFAITQAPLVALLVTRDVPRFRHGRIAPELT